MTVGLTLPSTPPLLLSSQSLLKMRPTIPYQLLIQLTHRQLYALSTQSAPPSVHNQQLGVTSVIVPVHVERDKGRG